MNPRPLTRVLRSRGYNVDRLALLLGAACFVVGFWTLVGIAVLMAT